MATTAMFDTHHPEFPLLPRTQKKLVMKSNCIVFSSETEENLSTSQTVDHVTPLCLPVHLKFRYVFALIR